MASNDQVEVDKAEFIERRVTRSATQTLNKRTPAKSDSGLLITTPQDCDQPELVIGHEKKLLKSPVEKEELATGRKHLRDAKKWHAFVPSVDQASDIEVAQAASNRGSCTDTPESHSPKPEATKYGSSSGSENEVVADPANVPWTYAQTYREEAHNTAIAVSEGNREAKRVIRKRRSSIDIETRTKISKTFYYSNGNCRWPHRGKPTVEDCVNAGLKYIGDRNNRDMVKCIRCKRTLRGFQPGEDPAVEHRKQYPDCH